MWHFVKKTDTNNTQNIDTKYIDDTKYTDDTKDTDDTKYIDDTKDIDETNYLKLIYM